MTNDNPYFHSSKSIFLKQKCDGDTPTAGNVLAAGNALATGNALAAGNAIMASATSAAKSSSKKPDQSKAEFSSIYSQVFYRGENRSMCLPIKVMPGDQRR